MLQKYGIPFCSILMQRCSDPAQEAMSSSMPGFPQIQKFGGGELVTALIATPILPNFWTQKSWEAG